MPGESLLLPLAEDKAQLAIYIDEKRGEPVAVLRIRYSTNLLELPLTIPEIEALNSALMRARGFVYNALIRLGKDHVR